MEHGVKEDYSFSLSLCFRCNGQRTTDNGHSAFCEPVLSLPVLSLSNGSKGCQLLAVKLWPSSCS